MQNVQIKSLMWLEPLSISFQCLLTIGMLKLMNLTMSLIVTPKHVLSVLELEKMQILLMHRTNFTLALEIGEKHASDIGTHACAYCKSAKWKTFIDASCD